MSIQQNQEQQTSEQQNLRTAAELRADSMFNNLFSKDEEEETYKQTTLHNRLTYIERQKYGNNFDTYPPKRNSNSKSLQEQYQRQQQNNSLSTSNILQTTALKRAMSSRNSPYRNKNTVRAYTKRTSAKRSFSESSAEKLNRYTTSDSSTSQDEDELMMSTSEKRKITRRSLNSGLHKYQHHPAQQRSRRLSQYLDYGGAVDDDGNVVDCSTMFGKHSQYVSDMIDIGIRVILVVVFR